MKINNFQGDLIDISAKKEAMTACRVDCQNRSWNHQCSPSIRNFAWVTPKIIDLYYKIMIIIGSKHPKINQLDFEKSYLACDAFIV